MIKKFAVRPIIIAFLAKCMIIFSAGLVLSQSLYQIQTPYAVFVFEKALQKPAQTLADAYPRIQTNLEKIIGWKLDYSPTIVLTGHKNFLKMAGSPFFAAFAVPSKKLIVLDNSKMIQPLSLEITLKHELCHLLIHRHIKNIPKWLDEGVAQWVSDGLSELLVSRQKNLLQGSVISGQILDLNEITYGFPHNENGLLLAYEQSKNIVEYMAKTHGRQGVLNVLNGLKSGQNIETALYQSLNLSLAQMEQNWHKDLRKTSTWLIYAAINIYEILFFLAAVASIWGAVRLAVKKRQYVDEFDDDDWD